MSDRAYIDAQVTGHEQALTLLRKARKTIQNASLIAFVEQTIPVVEHHLNNARTIQMTMMNGVAPGHTTNVQPGGMTTPSAQPIISYPSPLPSAVLPLASPGAPTPVGVPTHAS
jgi:uncharacterized protein (DUF305 family)